MTPIQANVALAEAGGWTPNHPEMKERGLWTNPNDTSRSYWLPDAWNNMSALHDLRKTIIKDLATRSRYCNTLREVVGRRCEKNKVGTALVSDSDVVLAEPHEHTEAILRAIGAWE